MGFEKGRKSRSSCLWLTHDDVAAFSNALEVALPELRWHCIHVGNSPIRHEYATVEGASNCDLGETNDFFRQAYTKLPFGGRSTLGMLLLNFVARYQKIIVPERDFGRHPAASPCSRSGVAALRWSKHRRSARRCESHRAPDRVGGGIVSTPICTFSSSGSPDSRR